MKIATVGCSWTAGIMREWSLDQSTPEQKTRIPNEDFVNWPRELGKLKPEWQIDNYAIPGASLLLAVKIAEQIKTKYDLVILQLTTADRYSSWSEKTNFESFLIKKDTNTRMFNEGILNNVIIYESHFKDKSVWNTSPMFNKNKENEFINYYYYRNSDEMFNLNHKALFFYIKERVDIVFSHRSYKWCQSVEDTLGKEAFDNFIMDKGFHFGLEGAQWEAKWVLNQINTKSNKGN